MALCKASGAAALVATVLLGTLAVPATPVSAQTFFDRLFNTREHREYLRRQEMRREIRAAPKVRISSPRVYTYRPDLPVAVTLGELAAALAPAEQTAPPPVLYDAAFDPGFGYAPADAGPGPAETAFAQARDALATITLRALPEVAAALKAHYRAHPAFLWVSDGAVNARSRAAEAVFGRADAFGLSSADYQVDPADDGVTAGDPKALMRFEMALSATALTYALDAERGRVDPNRLSGYHDLPRHAVALAAVLAEIAAGKDVAAVLEGRNPDNERFAALQAELAVIRAKASEEDPIEIADGTLIKPGETDPELADVVVAIGRRGSDALKAEHAATLAAYQGEETYTPELVALVRGFQTDSGLHADGIVGRNTIRALVGDSNADKVRKIELAMERLRWLPRELGARHVFINQPAFTATYHHAGKEPLAMRAVVGKTSNQTNFFYDEIETVEYNPYWGVPLSIIVNEMLPELSRDPSYLDRMGYEVTTVSGRRVASAAVDWYGVATKATAINVRQPPGPKNALGELKILFPNKHDIYMHDTPAKSLFQRDSRAYSHGCVRLQDPRRMAAAVLGTTTDHIAGRIAEGRNISEPVPGRIPVYSAYFTVWPQTDGTIGYFADVYGRDANLSRALQLTSAARQAES